MENKNFLAAKFGIEVEFTGITIRQKHQPVRHPIYTRGDKFIGSPASSFHFFNKPSAPNSN
jgi:hypothetical protein